LHLLGGSMNKQFSLDIIFVAALSINVACAHNVALIDTEGHQSHNYRTLTTLLSTDENKVHFYNLYELLEGINIALYDSVFFLVSTSFARAIKTPLAQSALKPLQDFAHQRNKRLAILLPSPNYSPVLHTIAHAIIATLNGIPNYPQQDPQLTSILDAFLRYSLQADAQQGMLYGTTLLNKTESPQPTLQQTFNELLAVAHKSSCAHLLPSSQQTTALPAQALPHALVIKNEKNNTTFLIGKLTDFTYADREENFFKNSFDVSLRDTFLAQTNHIVHEFLHEGSQKNMVEAPSTLRSAMRKDPLTQKSLDPRYSWVKEQGISCAWLSLEDMFGADYDAKNIPQQQRESIRQNALQNCLQFIYNAKLNLLWFEFIPEWFLGPYGYRNNKREQFITRIKILAAALKKQFANAPMPKIFVGTNVTTNFREQIARNSVTDLYGINYPNIPSPLDIENFWQPELLESIQTFVKLFDQELPIDGIFLDLEMYHAQTQLGSYNDLHDFSDYAWNLFAQATKKPELTQITKHEARIEFLRNHNLFKNYFMVLEKKAEEIGSRIKNNFQALLPHALVGAYTMTLPSSWFYQGFLRGLSSSQAPVILATFNTDFDGHAAELEKEKIFVVHGAVFMLSKLQRVDDSTAIARLRSHHDFVWFNRASRMGYNLTPDQQKQQYWALEASSLPAHVVAEEIRKMTEKI